MSLAKCMAGWRLSIASIPKEPFCNAIEQSGGCDAHVGTRWLLAGTYWGRGFTESAVRALKHGGRRMDEWQSIETAPWLEPIIATWRNHKGTPVVCMVCKHLIHTGVDSSLSETLNLERLVHYWSIDMSGEEQLEVNPTHWMPMPDPPNLKEKKDDWRSCKTTSHKFCRE